MRILHSLTFIAAAQMKTPALRSCMHAETCSDSIYKWTFLSFPYLRCKFYSHSIMHHSIHTSVTLRSRSSYAQIYVWALRRLRVCVCVFLYEVGLYVHIMLSLSFLSELDERIGLRKREAWISAAPLADWLWVLPTQCHFSHFTQLEQNNTFRSMQISRVCKIWFDLQHLGNLLYRMSMMNAKLSSYRYIIVPGSFSDNFFWEFNHNSI